MKKTLSLIALLVTAYIASVSFAQNADNLMHFSAADTLSVFDREPTFYYWDTVWFDKYLTSAYGGYWWQPWSFGYLHGCRTEWARYCYTDSPLRVIGIAAAMDMYYIRRDGDTSDAWPNTEPEFFNLYEVDTATNDMILLASKSWNGLTPRYLQQVYYNHDPLVRLKDIDFAPVFEVFFDSAITVHDSFYVASTSNNVYYPRSRNKPYFRSSIVGISAYQPYAAPILPQPNHFRRKAHSLPDQYNDDDGFHGFYATDTNWHTYAHCWADTNGNLGPANDIFPFIFPIIDTSRYELDTVCHRPADFGIMSLSTQSVMLSWNSSNAMQWELRVSPDGGMPETGTSSIWTAAVATLTDLQPGKWHCAWVRAICDSNSSSPWSERLRFFVPNDSSHVEDIQNIVNLNTHVIPNPAKDAVTVASSFRMSSVEVWTLNGQLALKQEVDGIITHIDISNLSRGTYILRINTNNGLAYKKLVVE